MFTLLRDAQQKMSGYAMYMNYQFIHFSVKAEPAALLSVAVEINGESLDLEEVADVAIPEEDQFALIPKDQDMLFAICKAVGFTHPEYKIEPKTMNDSEEDSNDSDTEEDQDQYILCTMPAVNKDRRDAGMDYVKTIYDETLTKIEGIHGTYSAKITKELAEAKPQEIDEAKEELKKLYDQHLDLCKTYREEKEKQIEEAYQKYLEAQTEKENSEREKQAAHDTGAGKQINLEDFASDSM